MLRVIKRLSCVAVLIFASAQVFAQKVNFEIGAPDVVAVGETFRIEFTLNAKPEEFTPPSFTGFDVLAGPTPSEGHSVEIIGSNVTKSVSFSYTYVLQAQAAGTVTIPSAQVKVEGKTYTTRPYPIEVVTADAIGSGEGTGQKASIAANDLLLRVGVNRNSVYKGQPVRVTFKLYTRVPISGIESVKYPAFNGFWTHELDVDNYQWQRETLNGKVYNTRIIKEALLYPQQSGQLHIEQSSLTVVAQLVTQVQSANRSLFDDFFGGGQTVEEVRKNITAAPVQITVKDFPAGAPASFNGAVGQFQMAGSLEKSVLTANSSGTYTLRISGNGNLPLIQSPQIGFPSSFEKYNIKTTESLNASANGISGYRQFEYPFIPRGEGDYTVPAVEFSYFDPEQVKFITLNTAALTVEVAPDSTGGGSASERGIVSGINREELKILDRDIRFIKIGAPDLRPRGKVFFASTAYFICMTLLAVLFAGACFYLRKYLGEMRNTTLVRNRKANKVALQRLKTAGGHMDRGDEKRFYEEMLKALWGYMSDKLNIPVANLTKDNIREELLKRGIAQDPIARFIDIISDCEYAQYSPSTSGRMEEIYTAALNLLSKFESAIKR